MFRLRKASSYFQYQLGIRFASIRIMFPLFYLLERSAQCALAAVIIPQAVAALLCWQGGRQMDRWMQKEGEKEWTRGEIDRRDPSTDAALQCTLIWNSSGKKDDVCLSVCLSFLPPFLPFFPHWLTPSESIDSRREGRQGCRWRSVLQQQHCFKAMREGTRQGNETLQMKSGEWALPLSKDSSSLFPFHITLMEDLSYSYMEILIYPRFSSSGLLNVSSRPSFCCCCCFWRFLHARSISPGLLALHAGWVVAAAAAAEEEEEKRFSSSLIATSTRSVHCCSHRSVLRRGMWNTREAPILKTTNTPGLQQKYSPHYR